MILSKALIALPSAKREPGTSLVYPTATPWGERIALKDVSSNAPWALSKYRLYTGHRDYLLSPHVSCRNRSPFSSRMDSLPKRIRPCFTARLMLDRLLWSNTVVTPIPQIRRSNQFMQARGAEWAGWKKSTVIHILENFSRVPKAFRDFFKVVGTFMP